MAKRKSNTTPKPQIHKQVHHKVKLAVVPHAANQYRPYLVRFGGLVALLLVVFGLQFGYNWSQTGSVLGVEATVTSGGLLDSLNKERQQEGKEKLRYDEKLSNAAYLKAQDMLKQQYWAHNAPDGTTPWYWLAEADYNYAYAGENLAKNFTTASGTAAAWMGSPAHRKNVLDERYSDVGFAVIDGSLEGKTTKLIVALFAAPSREATVAGAVGNGAAPTGPLSLVAQFGVALQSITPAALGSVILLLFAAVVALGAQAYRRKLPAAVRRSWRYHHGLYKAIGLSVIAVMVVTLYSGGQI